MTNLLQQTKTKRLLFGAFVTMTAFAVSSNIVPPLITTIADEMAVDYTSVGYIVMFQFLSFFVAGIFGGWICEHYNLNGQTFILTGLLIVAATLLIGSMLTSL